MRRNHPLRSSRCTASTVNRLNHSVPNGLEVSIRTRARRLAQEKSAANAAVGGLRIDGLVLPYACELIMQL